MNMLVDNFGRELRMRGVIVACNTCLGRRVLKFDEVNSMTSGIMRT